MSFILFKSLEQLKTFLSTFFYAYLPNALSMTLLSILMLAGMVRISLYPLAAAAMASPMPVLPDVGSTSIVLPSVVRTDSAYVRSCIQ